MKIIVSAGGTGGHIYPALAIIKKFQEKEKNLEVLYIGTHNRMEKEIVPKLNIKYEEIEVYGFTKNIFHDLKNLYLMDKAQKKCREIMKEFKPDVVIGCGGYVTFPVVGAAQDLKIPNFIHEQNSIPGKANVLLATKSSLVGVSFRSSEEYFKNADNIRYTGNPCGDMAVEVKKTSKATLGFKPSSKLIIIVAGSLGSKTFNDKFKAYLSMIEKEKYNVLYITGKSHYEEFIKDTNFPSNVKVVPFYDNLASIMKDADLVISRAGASTISEILALKIPSILIPSPYVANNHQYYNALDLKNMHVAELIEEKDLDPSMIQVMVNELLYNGELYKKMKANLEKVATISSSTIIYNEIKRLL